MYIYLLHIYWFELYTYNIQTIVQKWLVQLIWFIIPFQWSSPIEFQNMKDMIFFGSCALSGKMLLVRIVENNKIDAYYRAG